MPEELGFFEADIIGMSCQPPSLVSDEAPLFHAFMVWTLKTGHFAGVTGSVITILQPA
jgi:hypothetical protein